MLKPCWEDWWNVVECFKRMDESRIGPLKIELKKKKEILLLPELHSWGQAGWPGDGWQLRVCQSADRPWPRLQLCLHVARPPVQLQLPGAGSQLRARSWPEADPQLLHRPRSALSIARAVTPRPPHWCWCRDHGPPCQPHGWDSKMGGVFYIWIFLSTVSNCSF